MVWVRLDDRFPEHPKVASLSDAAFRLHVEALCYCARTLSNGFIPKAFLDSGCNAKRNAVTLRELTKAPTGYQHGLWEEKEDGWIVHDFLKYNPKRSQVQRRRKVTAERVKRHRNAKRNAVTNANVTLPPNPFPNPSKPPPPPQGGEGFAKRGGRRAHLPRESDADRDPTLVRAVMDRLRRWPWADGEMRRVIYRSRLEDAELLRAAESSEHKTAFLESAAPWQNGGAP